MITKDVFSNGSLPIFFLAFLKKCFWTSLAVQELGVHTSNAGGTGSVPGQRTKIPHAARRSQKIF